MEIRKDYTIASAQGLQADLSGLVWAGENNLPCAEQDVFEKKEGSPSFLDRMKSLVSSMLPHKANPEKELTVLFYMNGQYYDIGEQVAESFLNLEEVGSDANMNLVAQMGRVSPTDNTASDGGVRVPIDSDWTGIRRYEITKSDHGDLSIPVSEWLSLEPEMPRNPYLAYVISETYRATGDKVKAMEYYDKAVEFGIEKCGSAPGDPEVAAFRREFRDKKAPLDKARMKSKHFDSKVLKKLDEGQYMSSPDTLEKFVEWGMKNYPAKHYMIVFMGHGNAWKGVLGMKPADISKSVIEGVKKSNAETGRNDKVDVMAFSACLAGNAEALAEMKNASDITIASENVAYTTNLYEWGGVMKSLQEKLGKDLAFDSSQFSKDLIGYFHKKGTDLSADAPKFKLLMRSFLTLAAVDNRKMDQLEGSWKEFVQSLKDSNVGDREFFDAVCKARNYFNQPDPDSIFGYQDHLRDMGSIAVNIIKSDAMPPPVKEAALRVKESLQKVLIAETHEMDDREGSTGISVYAPNNAGDIWNSKGEYEKAAGEFAVKTGWSAKLDESTRRKSGDLNDMASLHNEAVRRDAELVRNDKMSLMDRSVERENIRKMEAEARRIRNNRLWLND
jgi:hypothetical protein